MRPPRVRLRTIMLAIAFLALAMTVAVQSLWLQRALVREQQLRNVAEFERARAIKAEEEAGAGEEASRTELAKVRAENRSEPSAARKPSSVKTDDTAASSRP